MPSRQSQSAESTQLHRLAKNEHRTIAHRQPNHHCQNRKHCHRHPKLPIQIPVGVLHCPLPTDHQYFLSPWSLLSPCLLGPLFPWSLVPCLFPVSLYFWCTGEDSNLRSSKERQIYSLLPLTARPPVPIRPGAKTALLATPWLPHPNSAAAPSSANAAAPHPSSAHAATSGRSPELPDISPEVDSPRSQNPGVQNLVPAGQLLPLSSPVPASILWSWRRDLNPRPSDYKSDALPAELRQLFHHPEAFPEPDSCADTLQLSAYTAQKSRLAHRRTASKR